MSILREHHVMRKKKKIDEKGKKKKEFQERKKKDITRSMYDRHALFFKLGRRNSNAVRVTVEEHSGALTLGTLGGLNPVAHTGTSPESLEESGPASVGLSPVVRSHDLLDGLAGLIGVVEGDGADIVVENVGLDDTVEDVTADEAEVTVDGGSGTTGKVPDIRLVVGEGGVGVLEVGDGDYIFQSVFVPAIVPVCEGSNLPSQWFTQR